MAWIERQRSILDFTLGSLLRRRGKNGALLVVYTLVIFLLASTLFFVAAVKQEAAALLQDAPALIVQRIVAGRHDLIPASYVERIKGIRGVGRVRGRLWGYYYDGLYGTNYTLLVPEAFTAEPGSVIVGSGVARHAMAEEGNLMPLRAVDGKMTGFTVARVLPASTEMVAADLVLMAEADYRTLLGVPAGLMTDLVVEVPNGAEATTIAQKIARLLPDTRPITRREILGTYEAVFNWRGGIMLALLAGSVLAFIIFAWDRATGLSAEERREIGILKALGWETSDVLLLKFWEGTCLSLTAFLFGTLLAYAHVFFTKAVLFAPVLKGWSVLYPDFRLTPAIDFQQLTTLFFLTVLPFTVATLVPAWRVATVDPDAVLRGL